MMTGPLSPKVHGFFDYATALLLAFAPSLFTFGGVAAGICYVLALGLLGISLITAYPLGVTKVVPFTVHGIMEAVIAPVLIVGPWLFGFANVPSARNFFLAVGIGLGILFLVTNYKAAERPQRRKAVRQHA